MGSKSSIGEENHLYASLSKAIFLLLIAALLHMLNRLISP